MSQVREYILRVGESGKVKRGILTSYSVVYAGMISDSTYSVVVTVTTGYNSMAYNLYIPKGQSEVQLPKGRMVILSVSTEEIHFRYQ